MPAPRIDVQKVAPAAIQALYKVEEYIKASGLDYLLVHLVKMRASQINGCAFCLDMHSRDTRRHGETEQRLYVLSGWRDSSLYSAKERAALAWTEALTNISQGEPSDDLYEDLRRHFSEKEIVDLTVLVGQINLWNRLAVSMGSGHLVQPAAVAA